MYLGYWKGVPVQTGSSIKGKYSCTKIFCGKSTNCWKDFKQQCENRLKNDSGKRKS